MTNQSGVATPMISQGVTGDCSQKMLRQTLPMRSNWGRWRQEDREMILENREIEKLVRDTMMGTVQSMLNKGTNLAK